MSITCTSRTLLLGTASHVNRIGDYRRQQPRSQIWCSWQQRTRYMTTPASSTLTCRQQIAAHSQYCTAVGLAARTQLPHHACAIASSSSKTTASIKKSTTVSPGAAASLASWAGAGACYADSAQCTLSQVCYYCITPVADAPVRM